MKFLLALALLVFCADAYEIPVPEVTSLIDLGLEFGPSEGELDQGVVVDDPDDWLDGYSSVELVVFDYRAAPKMSLVEGGRPHPGILPEKTVKLTKSEIESLLGCVTGKQKPEMGALCYLPHHGFIFYDEKGAILGHLELCLMCGVYKSHPEKGLSRYWNLVGIEKLIESKGIPVFNDVSKWQKYFEQN